jgi:hypothetical protein
MPYTTDPSYNPYDMKRVIDQAHWIVRNHREWFNREVQQANLHKFVIKAIEMARPDQWQHLMLQWPHMADNAAGDYTRVAYTRDERAGIANRQVVTTLGKYLRAHFSVLPDEAIRDIVALAQSAGANFKIVRTSAEMIYHLTKGPGSCMKWEDDGVRDLTDELRHPYEAYSPALGWAMAVRIEDNDTVGRALINEANDQKIFVRTYKKSQGYSPADEQLEAWLKEQGYEHVCSWVGRRLKVIPTDEFDCGFIAPFLDGDYKGVTRDGANLVITRHDEEFMCSNTDGSADEVGGDDCSNCGERVRNGDGYWVGSHEDEMVCESCRDNDYVYAYGRRGNQYYIHQNYAVYVDSQSEYFHESYTDDNDIVQLRNGEYEHTDDAVEIDGDYYHVDDDRIVRCVDDDQFHLIRDVYLHKDSDEYYADESKMPKADEPEDDEPTPESE